MFAAAARAALRRLDVAWPLLVLTAACETKTPPAVRTSAPASKSSSPPASAPSRSPAATMVARIAAVSGDVRILPAAPAPVAGALLPEGRVLVTGKDGRLAVDLDNGARCVLYGDGLALLPRHERGAWVLSRGRMHVLAAGQGSSLRAPVRIMTSTFLAEGGRSGEAWVSAAGGATGQIAVLAGAFDVETAGTAPAELAPIQVLAGRRLRVDGGLRRVEPGPGNLAAAEELPRPPASPPLPSVVNAVERAFVDARAGLDAELEAQRRLREAQRDAHRDQQRERVRELQAEIVERAQRVIAHKRTLRRLYGQRLAMEAAALSAGDLTAVERIAGEYAGTLR